MITLDNLMNDIKNIYYTYYKYQANDINNYCLHFPRFIGHTEEFQLRENKVEVCHGYGEG